jgi:2-keto-4-pentenoate hydratase/2-oxohepta-3-ene-1,7-dioic acid hydratase in catechol pathway
MQLIRFVFKGRVLSGIRLDDANAQLVDGDFLDGFEKVPVMARIEKLLPPIVPSNILCIGLNYRAHAAESNSPIPQHPVLFIKNSNALNTPYGDIELPDNSSQVDYEAELAIVIGKDAKKVSREQAMEYVLGYCVANDVSARDWQRELARSGTQWCRAKSFDGFCPLGPWITTRDEVPNPNKLRVRSILNGQTMQDSSTSDMIFDVPALIESLSSTMTIAAGTVILTGTPPGVGFARKPPVFMKKGDVLRTEIEALGYLENKIV